MMFSKFVTAALVLLCGSGVSGFANLPSKAQSSATSLKMLSDKDMKKAATSFVAAAFLMSNAALMPPALAMDDMDFGSSQVIAGRSGGRAGGRSSGARMRSMPSSPSRTTIHRTTVVSPPVYHAPSVIIAPPMMGGYGYNPMGGLGMSLGLNAMSNIGNDMRDYRQEGEIQRTKADLENSKMRETEMETRLRNLEMSNKINAMSPEQQQQLMLMMQQQQTQPAK